MKKTIPKLAILDWGIGGLGFYRLFKKAHPGCGILYFSDSGYEPYGLVKTQDLVRRIEAICDYLSDKGATHLVIACHSASTAIPYLKNPALEVWGIIEASLQAIRGLSASSLGVVGGRRTIKSGLYQKKLSHAGTRIVARVAQPISAHIEAGRLDSFELQQDLKRILKPLKSVDALLLACTHYPAIGSQFQALLPRARIIDPAETLLTILRQNFSFKKNEERDLFLTTGDKKKMASSAQKAFGVGIEPEPVPDLIRGVSLMDEMDLNLEENDAATCIKTKGIKNKTAS